VADRELARARDSLREVIADLTPRRRARYLAVPAWADLAAGVLAAPRLSAAHPAVTGELAQIGLTTDKLVPKG
jgi:hypothetical protein